MIGLGALAALHKPQLLKAQFVRFPAKKGKLGGRNEGSSAQLNRNCHAGRAAIERPAGVTIPERVNSPAQRLQANETVPGKARVTDLHRLLPLQIQVTTEYYFEEGELLSEATLKQTPLEKEAGF